MLLPSSSSSGRRHNNNEKKKNEKRTRQNFYISYRLFFFRIAEIYNNILISIFSFQLFLAVLYSPPFFFPREKEKKRERERATKERTAVLKDMRVVPNSECSRVFVFSFFFFPLLFHSIFTFGKKDTTHFSLFSLVQKDVFLNFLSLFSLLSNDAPSPDLYSQICKFYASPYQHI